LGYVNWIVLWIVSEGGHCYEIYVIWRSFRDQSNDLPSSCWRQDMCHFTVVDPVYSPSVTPHKPHRQSRLKRESRQGKGLSWSSFSWVPAVLPSRQIPR